MTSLLTISSKGQITLPPTLLSILGVSKGDKIIAKPLGKTIVVEPLGQGILSLVGTMPKLKRGKGLSVEDLIKQSQEDYFDQALR